METVGRVPRGVREILLRALVGYFVETRIFPSSSSRQKIHSRIIPIQGESKEVEAQLFALQILVGFPEYPSKQVPFAVSNERVSGHVAFKRVS